MNKHVQRVELPNGTLMTIEGGNSEDTAQRIIQELGGSVKKPATNSQPTPAVINDLLVLCNGNGSAASAAPQPPPEAITALEVPSTADPNWPNRYVPPVPYQTEPGTWRRTPLFSENAQVTPLESPEPTFVPENKTPTERPQNYRPSGTDGLVNNGITPLELPVMKF